MTDTHPQIDFGEGKGPGRAGPIKGPQKRKPRPNPSYRYAYRGPDDNMSGGLILTEMGHGSGRKRK